MRTLEHHHFAEKDSQTGKYRLGSTLLELGVRALARFDLPTIARPYLEKLSADTGETSRLAVLADREVVSIAVARGQHALQISATVGGKAPVHCSALGKAILALLPESDLNIILRSYILKAYTRHTITRRSALNAELAEIRKRGFSIDDQELEHGLKCIGAPVLDSSGKAVAAVSIAGAAVRLTRKRVSVVAP